MTENSDLHQLPREWVKATIGELSFLVTKGSTPTTYGFNYQPQGINYIKVENIENARINKKSLTQFITQEANDFLKRSQLVENDILFSIAGTIGRVGIVNKEDLPANINQAIAIIRCPWQYVNPRYLRLFLESPSTQQAIKKRPRGVGMNNISLEDIKGIEALLPPFNEQQRIVGKVEELFSFLDAGVASLRVVQAQLKRYRQAVLKAAFEGKLSMDWRKNDNTCNESAPELLNKIIDANKSLLGTKKIKQAQKNDSLAYGIESRQLPEGWIWVTGGQLFYRITSGSRWWAKYYSHDGAFFIRVGDLSHDKISINFKDTQYVKPPAGAEVERTRVSPSDLLISITADVGRVALVPDQVKEAYVNQHVALAKSLPLFDRSYVGWFLLSPYGQKQLTNLQYGVTKAGLGLDDIKQVRIPFPPLSEQQIIVKKIENSLYEMNVIEEIIKQSLKKKLLLSQCILKEAFEGKLVPQDLNDEPADKLLERIKTERLSIKSKSNQLELSKYVK